MSEAIEVAVKWWADQLRGTPKMDAGDAQINFMLAAFGADRKPMSEEKIEAFASALRELIADRLANDYHCAAVHCDYHPEGLLVAAIRKAGLEDEPGINHTRFPIKTMMDVTSYLVTVSCGYGAPWETIWAKEEA